MLQRWVNKESTFRNTRIICLFFLQENYKETVCEPTNFRKIIDYHIELFPELFPSEIVNGYLMKDIYLGFRIFYLDEIR